MGSKEETVKFLSEQTDITAPFAEVVYDLVVNKDVDRLRIRNAMLISEYDTLVGNGAMCYQAHRTVASKYNVSVASVKYILQNRKYNEIS